jgi:hypothetical protein
VISPYLIIIFDIDKELYNSNEDENNEENNDSKEGNDNKEDDDNDEDNDNENNKKEDNNNKDNNEGEDNNERNSNIKQKTKTFNIWDFVNKEIYKCSFCSKIFKKKLKLVSCILI